MSHARRAAAGSPLGTCKALSRLAARKTRHARVTASWGEPKGQKPERVWHSLRSPEAASMKGKGGGMEGLHKKKKNVTASKREYNPLITLLGFSGEQRVNLRGSRSRDSEGADREGPGLPDARAEPDPRRQGAADDELGSLPERPPRLPGTVVDQTPDNQSRPAPPRGDGESE